MSRRTAMLVSGWLLAVAGVSPGQDQGQIDAVRAAWKDREAKVRTARFEWKQTVFTVKGAYDAGKELVMERNGGKDPGSNPPEDHSYSSDCILSIDGDRVVYQFTQRNWKGSENRYCDTRVEYKFDGEKQLFLDNPGFTQWSVALIRKQTRGADFPPDTRPVVRTLRGTNPKFRPDDFDEYVPSGVVLQIGDGRGRELMSKGGPGRDERHLWTDPTRGFVVLRCTSGMANRVLKQIDVKYKADGTAGWVPTEWKIIETNPKDGRVTASTTATVTSYSINEPVDEATFAFTLPRDCRVSDESESPHDFIIRDDGSTRVLAPSDFGKTYQEIVSTPGPSSGGWRRWTGLLMAGFVGLGILLVVARVWLIRRSSRQVIPPTRDVPPGQSGPGAGDEPA